MRARPRLIGLLGSGVLALGVSACGGGENGDGTRTDRTAPGPGAARTLDVYSSLPLQGPSRRQTRAMVQAIRLALDEAGGRAGRFRVNYQSLDDSTARAGGWDPLRTAQNARRVARDGRAVYFIGELDSGASEVSMPILNVAGIPQVSPANTAVGLTSDDPGHASGQPEKYYPNGRRHYVRLVPRDTVQAAALLTTMRQDGCTNVALANDRGVYGAGLTRVVGLQAEKAGLAIVDDAPLEMDAGGLRAVAQQFARKGADCFLFGGTTSPQAVALYRAIGAALPNARLYGADGVCESAFTNPADGGIPRGLGRRFKCTVGTPNLAADAAGRQFLRAFRAKYGDPHPDPYAIYAYEAMRLGLDAIRGLPEEGSPRQGVLEALFRTKDRPSALGRYSIDENGDTSLTDYGVYEVGPAGNPRFAATVTADQ